jgi:hypothetical protein
LGTQRGAWTLQSFPNINLFKLGTGQGPAFTSAMQPGSDYSASFRSSFYQQMALKYSLPSPPRTTISASKSTPEQTMAAAKNAKVRAANGGFDDSYMLNVIQRENIQQVEGNFAYKMPIIGPALKGYRYSMMGSSYSTEASNAFGQAVIEALPFAKIPSNTAISINTAAWSQKTFSATMSTEGSFAGRTVDDLVAGLTNGSMQVSDVPINVVVRNGQMFILNTRSSSALTMAGVPRSSWNVVNQTGVPLFENSLTNQLTKNVLPAGTYTIRQSGTQNVITHAQTVTVQ